jgi:hypothetical protein
MSLVTREGKGDKLTIEEMDGNLAYLEGRGFTHYVGESFGGGIVFHLWKDGEGVEHGLVVDINELGFVQWSNVENGLIGTTRFTGLENSLAIVSQELHENSAAAACLALEIDGYNDWYLPSIDELSLLFTNAFNINLALNNIEGGTLLNRDERYWSSSEYLADSVWYYDPGINSINTIGKDRGYLTRAIRKF